MVDILPGRASSRIVNLMDYRQAHAPRASQADAGDLPRLAAKPQLSDRAVRHRRRMLAHLERQLNRRAAR